MPKTILIADDSEGVRRIFVRLLKSKGYQIIEADNGDDVVKLATLHQVDLILTDLDMPGQGCLENLSQIFADPELCRIPILIVTGSDDPREVEEAITAGALDVIIKPPNFRLLLNRVQAYLAMGEKLAQERPVLRQANVG